MDDHHNSVTKWLLVLGLAMVLAAAIAIFWRLSVPKTKLLLGDGLYTAQIAATNSARSQGLSGTKSLNDNQAMLFVFDYSDRWGIWMKDMKIPIDIVWLDESKKVVTIKENVSPDNGTNEIFRPTKPARYVVELPAGAVKQKTIKLGAIAKFNETDRIRATL